MPQEFPHRADVVPIFEQTGGKTVAEGVAGNALVDPGPLDGLPDGLLQAALIDMVGWRRTAPEQGIS